MARTPENRLPVPAGRQRGALVRAGGRKLPKVYLARARQTGPGIFQSEHADPRHGSSLKWLISTCITAGLAAFAIGFVIFAAVDDQGGSLYDQVERVTRVALAPAPAPTLATASIASARTDRLQFSAKGLITKLVIHDSVRVTRNSREFIAIKPYERLVMSLPTMLDEGTDEIPPFNPFSLYAPAKAQAGDADESGAGRIAAVVVELAGGLLPAEDALELSTQEVAALVAQASEELAASPAGPEGGPLPASEGAEADPVATVAAVEPEPLPANTAVVYKNVFEDEGDARVDGQEVRAITVGNGDTLAGVLARNDVEAWQAKAVAESAKAILSGGTLEEGQEVRLTLVPSLAREGGLEPSLVSVFSEGHRHVVTVARSAAGEFTATESPVAAKLVAPKVTDAAHQRASLYSSLYATARAQGLPKDMIETILKTFAYDTDFKRRVGPGDGLEAFFDLRDDNGDGEPGELLYMSLTVGGETRKFYRFRTPDGIVDYYDAEGNNAKRFLMRKPIRGNDIRFTSGFGMRLHPLLKVRRMHTGVDWSSASGTPIVAAGAGVIEEIGRKGGNGNYIRIRHANGYQTAYSHQSRFAPGLAVGSKVQQGQTIGYVGTTGLSSGPHLHFEVLVNNSYVDPMTIHVPRERQLTGKLLAEFQKERLRIGDLMGRSPVSSLQSEGSSNKG